jgi:hypothetical protein
MSKKIYIYLIKRYFLVIYIYIYIYIYIFVFFLQIKVLNIILKKLLNNATSDHHAWLN